MGQAVYDALVAFFNTNIFYFENAKSPFLIFQSGSSILRGEVTRTDGQIRYQMARYFPADLHHAATIEAVEDAYLAIEPTPIMRPLDVFSVNAQTSVQGSLNRRGGGWIVCCSPGTLDRIVEPKQMSALGFVPTPPMRIGRWNLRARKIDRCQHYWTADHLPDGDVWTIYRDADAGRLYDGLPVLQVGDGYVYPDAVQHYVERQRYLS